jgi:hypothetical protein
MVDSFSKRQKTNNLIDISDRSKSYFAIVNKNPSNSGILL